MNNDFNIEYKNINLRKKIIFNKKTTVLLIVLVIAAIALALYLFNNKKDSYSLKVDSPSIIYIDEPLNIPVTLKGPEKYLNDASTMAFSAEEVLKVTDEEVVGRSGSILVEPISLGSEDINIITTVGADKYSKTLAKKKIKITVCPKFEDELLSSKNMTIKVGAKQNLNIDFGDTKCSEIVTYDSTDANVVTVDDDGNITGINSGGASIRVFNGTANIIVNISVID